MSSRRRAGTLATAVAALALAAPGATATADTGLIQVLSPPKLKAAKKVSYQVSCSADCAVSATLKLVLPGKDLGPITVPSTGPTQFLAGEIAAPFIVLNKPAKKALRGNVGKAKLKTTITATNLATGQPDVVTRVFHFKR